MDARLVRHLKISQYNTPNKENEGHWSHENFSRGSKKPNPILEKNEVVIDATTVDEPW